MKLNKHFLLLIATIWLFNQLLAQCPQGRINFTFQHDVDEFIINFPDCTIIQGDLIISDYRFSTNDTIKNLSGLENITHIEGDLRIENNFGLTNLEGLQNLIAVGRNFFISRNAALANVDGVQSLAEVGGYLSITENVVLNNINGLESLSKIEGSLSITRNGSLNNLSGLQNLINVNEDILINRNEILTNLQGLNSLSSIKKDFTISSNPSLTNLVGLQNLSSILGEFKIERNSNLINLEGLESLTKVQQCLKIWSNSNLFNLKGISNPQSIGEILINKNDVLNDLDGLQNLTKINRSLYITENNALNSLNGLQNLEHIEGQLSIMKNDNLTDVDGLLNLTTIGYNGLYIYENAILNNLNGLQNLEYIDNKVTIQHNPQLVLCNPSSICNFLVRKYNRPGFYNINDNAPGCNHIDEILETCAASTKIQSRIFYDLNQNKIKEEEEPLLNFDSVVIQPGNNSTKVNSETGIGQYYVEPGVYKVTLDQDVLSKWSLTTDTTDFNFTLGEDTCAIAEFGMYPNEQLSEVNITMDSDYNSCDYQSSIIFIVNAQNVGTTIGNGILWFRTDTMIGDIEYIDEPDTIVEPHLYGWFYEYLIPGQRAEKQINLNLPYSPNFEQEDTLKYRCYSDVIDLSGDYTTSEVNYQVAIKPNRCTVSEGRFLLQSDVDRFSSTCTTICGNLEIGKSLVWTGSIKDLSNLQNVTSVEGDVIILNNTDLVDLNGLQNLTSIGGDLSIRTNYDLANLDGLQNLTTIGGGIYIDYNESLNSIEGLQNLTTIGGGIHIERTGLRNLKGLENITEIGGGISISSNNSLVSIKELQIVTNIDGNVSINSNTSLNSLEGLQNITAVRGNLSIAGSPVSDLNVFENLTTIEGGLSISSINALTNLSVFENLTTLNDFLSIYWNENLESLDGIQNVTKITGSISIASNPLLTNLDPLKNIIINIKEELRINDNDALISLDGLQNVTGVGGYLSIHDNDAITNFNGLQSITSVKESLYIANNSSLNSLDGLHNLTSIEGNMRITENPILNDINALRNATITTDYLSISNNPQLNLCSVESVCDFLSNLYDDEYAYVIEDNATGCSNVDEILENCPSYAKIQSRIFYDANQNKVFDADESLAAVGNVTISPGDITVVPNPDTGFAQYYLTPETYVVEFNTEVIPEWILTTDSTQYTITLKEDTCALIEFGIYPNEQLSDMFTYVRSPNNRCNDTIPFQISTHNTGSTITDGTLWFQVDTLISSVEYVDLPDTIIQPNQYGWFFEGLPPGQRIVKQMKLVVPGPPNFEIGDYLNYYSHCDYTDINGMHSTAKFYYNAEIRCSFDPNDKLVNPQRPCNYTLFSEPLNYTIRFQNTGNDIAENIVIRDTLDKNLNLSTFMVTSSSHPEVLSTGLIEENRLITFNFDAVNLPDSASNLEASQGYISYMIQPKDGLAENTSIENTSGIYFDYNPPIITNTVQSILVNELPTFTWCRDADNDGLGNVDDMVESCEQPEGYVADCTDLDDLVSIIDYELSAKVSICPNPSPGSFQIVLDKISFKDATFNVFNSAGVEVVSTNQISRTNQFYDYEHLSNGVYYVNINLDDKVFIQKKLLVLK